MYLYVWEDVLSDYTSGMVVALAPSLEVALETIRCESDTAWFLIGSTPPTYVIDPNQTKPVAFLVWGGG